MTKFKITAGRMIDAVCVRAYQLSGVGGIAPHYEVQDKEGKWYPFFKKDNPAAPLLAPKEMVWSEWVVIDRIGLRHIYKRECLTVINTAINRAA